MWNSAVFCPAEKSYHTGCCCLFFRFKMLKQRLHHSYIYYIVIFLYLSINFHNPVFIWISLSGSDSVTGIISLIIWGSCWIFHLSHTCYFTRYIYFNVRFRNLHFPTIFSNIFLRNFQSRGLLQCMWDTFWTGIHGMRFFKPGHYFRQRKKKAVRQKDQGDLVGSGENINRKGRREKKSNFLAV